MYWIFKYLVTLLLYETAYSVHLRKKGLMPPLHRQCEGPQAKEPATAGEKPGADSSSES